MKYDKPVKEKCWKCGGQLVLRSNGLFCKKCGRYRQFFRISARIWRRRKRKV